MSSTVSTEDTVRWLFLDLNSYFASCEQQLEPRYRGRPIAVVPMLADSTCVIAASYPAKAFGIKTGTRVGDAKRMCPGLILVTGRHEEYIRFHHEIIAACEKILPIESVLSVDEMAFKLTGSERKISRAQALGRELKTAIRREVGDCLTSSVGLAPNRYLAKVASDMQKPDGLTVLLQQDLPQKLLQLKLRDFPGIGPNMERRLLRFGVTTTEQLVRLSPEMMSQIWGGVGGERFHSWIRGGETHETPTKRHSIGHSHVLPPELRNRDGSFRVLQKLVIKAAFRLRRESLWAKRLEVSVRFSKEEESWSVNTGFFETQDTFTFLRMATELWESYPGERGRPYQVSIVLGGLVADGFHTPSFFEDVRKLQVSRTMDRINLKHGAGAVYFGSQHEARAENRDAPLRIAFSRIPELDEDF